MLGLRGFVAASAIACSLLASFAHADEPVPAPKPPSTTDDTVSKDGQRIWYGGPMLVTDFVASGLAVASLLVHSSQPNVPLLVTAGLAYGAGGPIVHAANGRPRMGAASLGLRIAAPLSLMGTGVLLGVPSTESCNRSGGEWCGLTEAIFGVIGFAVGVISAELVDDTAFAWKDRADAAPRPPTGLRIESLTPVMGMALDERQHRVPTFGVAASF
jgi:hypothetical protein